MVASVTLLKRMHEISGYIRLYEYLKEVNKTDLFDLNAFEIRLKEQVKSCITSNLAEWETSYICKPSQFFNSNESVFYEDNKELANYECDYIVKTQLEDGSYIVPWQWWKGNHIITNML